MFDVDWIIRNWPSIADTTGEHLVLSFLPVLLGLLIAIPVGIIAVHWTWVLPIVIVTSSAFFAIPSLAFFVFMLPLTGLTRMTAIIPLTIYIAALLVRNVIDGIRSTDESVRQAASAMGYGRLHRLVAIELPIATPIVLGGLRVATVANIGMVSVVSVIGLSSLGDFFVDGTQRFFLTPIVVGIVLSVLIAAVADIALVQIQRRMTPWSKGVSA
ncbi:ABC transporter permease [Micrococcaceae sp. AOP34-BR2-30]